MSKQNILATVLGAIVLFVWSAIAWMVIPWPGEPLRSFANEAAVEAAITANATQPGNYILPNPHRPGLTTEQSNTLADKMMRGPMMFAAIRLGPMRPFPLLMVLQFLIQFVSALIATFLVTNTAALSYGQRVLFVTLCGVLIFVGGKLDEWVWWSFSSAYTLIELVAIVIGWILAGLVIAKFARGRTAATA
jgi:hypothetical protein